MGADGTGKLGQRPAPRRPCLGGRHGACFSAFFTTPETLDPPCELAPDEQARLSAVDAWTGQSSPPARVKPLIEPLAQVPLFSPPTDADIRLGQLCVASRIPPRANWFAGLAARLQQAGAKVQLQVRELGYESEDLLARLRCWEADLGNGFVQVLSAPAQWHRVPIDLVRQDPGFDAARVRLSDPVAVPFAPSDAQWFQEELVRWKLAGEDAPWVASALAQALEGASPSVSASAVARPRL